MRYVAGVLGVNASTIQRTYQRYRDLGTYTRRPGSSHRRATSARDDRFLRIQVLRNRHTTAVEARGRLEQATGVHVSVWTARRRLQEGGLLARRPAMGPLLTRQHHTAYVDFARQHENWNEVQWKRVLFSDESRFHLRFPDGRERVWRRTGERYSLPEYHFMEDLSWFGEEFLLRLVQSSSS